MPARKNSRSEDHAHAKQVTALPISIDKLKRDRILSTAIAQWPKYGGVVLSLAAGMTSRVTAQTITFFPPNSLSLTNEPFGAEKELLPFSHTDTGVLERIPINNLLEDLFLAVSENRGVQKTTGGFPLLYQRWADRIGWITPSANGGISGNPHWFLTHHASKTQAPDPFGQFSTIKNTGFPVNSIVSFNVQTKYATNAGTNTSRDLGHFKIQLRWEATAATFSADLIDYIGTPGQPTEPTSTPEPTTAALTLLATGAAGVLALRRRRKSGMQSENA